MIIIGSDHAGIELKDKITEYLNASKIKFLDVSINQYEENDDYPDIAKNICSNVLANSNNIGIAICGTGIGISIVCNKHKGIRAANCTDLQMAEFSRRHNNANVLCLGSRLEFSKNFDNVIEIIDKFMNSTFDGGRHENRLNKILKIEDNTL